MIQEKVFEISFVDCLRAVVSLIRESHDLISMHLLLRDIGN